MDVETPSDLEALALAGREMLRGGDRVHDRWADTTPCSEWSVGDLVDHVVGGNVFTVEVLAGNDADAALATAMATFGEGYERRDALLATTEAQHEALTRPGALDGTYHHVAGELPGHEIVRARVHDLLVHGWDLAQALDPPAQPHELLVRWAVDELASTDSLTRASLGIDVGAVHDASSLLDAFGRRR